ncbi:MAG: LysM peptidoglycan-binding domain-containing protein [Thiohalocapsa sp.]
MRPTPTTTKSVWIQLLPAALVAVLVGLSGAASADTAADTGVGADAHPNQSPAAEVPSAPDDSARRIAQLEALYQAAEQERVRLARENSKLSERLRQSGALEALSQQVEKQTALLSRLAGKLGIGSGPADESMGQGVDDTALVDENARLRVALQVSERRLGLLMEQFAEAHKLRLDALAEAAIAREQSAELDARLRQRQQAADEALMRADKAEKLYAALEEAQARVSTENERLTRDLATARERQAEAMQRIVELDSLLAARKAQAVRISASAEPSGAQVADIGSATWASSESESADSLARRLEPVVYQVRADDTLSRISASVYGDASAWPRIFEANRDQLATPDDLVLGMRLIIP